MTPERTLAEAMGMTTAETRALAERVRHAAEPRTPVRNIPDVTTFDDPWSFDLEQRIQLAKSILGHTRPTDETTRTAITRALRALDGATIEQLQGEHA